jgi:TPR repeat protein
MNAFNILLIALFFFHTQSSIADFKSTLQLANQGDHQAQNYLANMYFNGIGVQQDSVEALRLFKLAAAQGNPDAQYQIGLMYRTGKGVPQDNIEAVKWYQLSAAQGDAMAQHNLGFMYDHGLGIDKNYDKAFDYYKLAAEQGLPEAQSKLGLAYFTVLKAKDIVLAYMWFALAASSNNEESKIPRETVVYIAKQMTTAQIAEAKLIIEACIIANYKNCERNKMKSIIANIKESKLLPESHIPLDKDPLNIRH